MAPQCGRTLNPPLIVVVLVLVLDPTVYRHSVRVTMLAKKMAGCLVQELVVEVW
jgi:hypothetical protein